MGRIRNITVARLGFGVKTSPSEEERQSANYQGKRGRKEQENERGGRMKLKVVVLGCVFLSAFLMAGSASATALQGDIRYMDPYLISEYANAFFADPLNYDGPWIQEIMSPSSNAAHRTGFPSDEVRVGMTLPSSMQFRNSDMAAEGPGVVNGETDLSQDAGLGAVEAPIGVGSEEDGALGVQPAGAEAGLDSKPEEDATEVTALEMGSSVTRRLAPVEEEENDDMGDDKEEEEEKKEEKKEEEEKEEKEEENEEMNTSGRRLLRRDDDDSVKAVYDEDALVKLLKAVGAGGRKLFGTSDKTEAQVGKIGDSIFGPSK